MPPGSAQSISPRWRPPILDPPKANCESRFPPSKQVGPAQHQKHPTNHPPRDHSDSSPHHFRTCSDVTGGRNPRSHVSRPRHEGGVRGHQRKGRSRHFRRSFRSLTGGPPRCSCARRASSGRCNRLSGTIRPADCRVGRIHQTGSRKRFPPGILDRPAQEQWRTASRTPPVSYTHLTLPTSDLE